ncbi:MAG: Arginine transport system permease protein ArtQ [Paracidovorax wautersii]|uniref:Arginine transport system permease protein ArtQ n=1 Tax=Paracidovorax wautersii TaxID=1177982 RepID=A0A7V8JQ41_9BURK|nr:MAG: Arginine transport system permease protein ArtQ [Paracidovorax wautersii]
MTFVHRLYTYLDPLASGLLVTAGLSATAILLGFALACLLHLARTRLAALGSVLVGVYVSFFRGTPLLVQILMLFYLPSQIGLDLDPWLAAIGVLAMNSAAFQSEILRAGFQAIPSGQIEAAQVFGLDRNQIFRHIQLPQVIRLTLPALVSESIDIIKGSAVISVIAITDLMRVGRQLTATTYRPLEVYLCVALAYLLLTTAVAWAGRRCARQPVLPR